ncbi:hypothetical protein HHI36_013627 [Cryptolaemus montrouzieri]|uniref:Peptidase S1 domain-containing protein n=1 Tax=Cryptolaemus montrouzieri TaxID=559131 RepID=A0ABD2NIG0_9CUCU
MLLSILTATFENEDGRTTLNYKLYPKNLNDYDRKDDFRIVGGTNTSVKEFPFMVSLQRNSRPLCGGSIISELFVLTAGHCVYNLSEGKLIDPLPLNVMAGQTVLDLGYGQFRDVKKLYLHSSYNNTYLTHDIGLVEVFGPFSWSPYTYPVELYGKTHAPYESHKYCTVIGWGITSPITLTDLMEKNKSSLVATKTKCLHKVHLETNSKSDCFSYVGFIPNLFDYTKLCSILKGGKGTCFGDSGGPLVCNRVQYGIISASQGCAQKGMPALFTDVSIFHDWVYGVLNNTKERVRTREVAKRSLKNNFRLGDMEKSISNSIQYISKLHLNLVVVIVLFMYIFNKFNIT